jgi:hypothetical protein
MNPAAQQLSAGILRTSKRIRIRSSPGLSVCHMADSCALQQPCIDVLPP